jgi:hypothetical protein
MPEDGRKFYRGSFAALLCRREHSGIRIRLLMIRIAGYQALKTAPAISKLRRLPFFSTTILFFSTPLTDIRPRSASALLD